MAQPRKLAAILVADIVGFSRLAGTEEERTLARLRGLWSDLIEPAIAAHQGRLVKRTGDGALVEFRSAVDATRCGMEMQRGLRDRNAGVPRDSRIEFRVGIHVGDVLEEENGDLMGDTVNIAARMQSICEPAGICLSEDAYRQVRDRVQEAFHDLGERSLKNIVRPVRAYLWTQDKSIEAASTPAQYDQALKLAVPDKPSIAVLPFQNMSGDPEQDYFADGIVDDIITGLSRIKWLFVIARNSSFVIKGKAVDVRQIGRELGVRYVLEGGVRRSAGRLRVTAQLVEAETGVHLWADRYDGVLEDIFSFQDQITDRVVGIVEPSVQRSEIERSRQKRPDNLNAYDLYLRALPYTASQMPNDAVLAIGLLEQALKLQPDYTTARALAAWCHEWCFARGGFDEYHRTMGLSLARSVVVGSTDDAAALAIAAFVIALLSGDRDTAINAADRALAFNPSSATALYLGAQIHAFAGHPDVATAYGQRALRLSPFDFLAYEAHMAQGMGAIQQSRFDEAASHYARAIQNCPTNSSNYLLAAASLALAGRLEEVRPLIRRGMELEPNFKPSTFSSWFNIFSVPEVADPIARGIALLNLPECG